MQILQGCNAPTEQRPGLQRDTARVDVLDQLSEHVRLELLDDQGLVLALRRLRVRSGHLSAG